MSTLPSPPRRSLGNEVDVFTDGDVAFEAAYTAIDTATRYVWLEMYIFEPDATGRLAIDALAAAARRGCDVVVLFDRWGSPRLGLRHAAPIHAAGGQIAVYNPILPWNKLGRKVAPFLHRDHRKVLIADDTAFVGGHNISMEYGGPGPELFCDMTLRLRGPCVRDLAQVFNGALRRATGTPHPLPDAPPPHPAGMPVQVLALDQPLRHYSLDYGIRALLQTARQRCYVATPYFIPPGWFIDDLVQAAQRGVDVRILTAGKSDVPWARLAGRHLYGRLLRQGIRIYEMRSPILHAKHLTIDGGFSVVGSYNVDRYGGKHNLEIGVLVESPAVALRLEHSFQRLLQRADEVTLSAWQQRSPAQRLLEWLLFLGASI